MTSILEQAHAAIVNGYNNAITSYKQQKDQFQKLVFKNSEEEMNKAMQSINNQVYNESSEEIMEKTQEYFDSVKGFLNEIVVNYIESGNIDTQIGETISKYRPKKDTSVKQQIKNLAEKMKEDLDFSKSGFLYQKLVEYLQTKNLDINQNDPSLMYNLLSYLRRLIVLRYDANRRFPGFEIDLTAYKQSLKGYLQEDAIEDAFKNALKSYGYNARGTGSVSNKRGQIIYDLILGPKTLDMSTDENINNIVKRMETQGEGTGKGELPQEFLGGIQSKSWNFSEGNISRYISFGYHSSLMPTGEEAYWWHAGVRNLMENMTAVIGPNNFIFATGSEINFTASLLAEFRKQNYVLAFYKPKEGKITSAKVEGIQHEDV